jgi:hydrogenase maturation protein HypF
MAHDASTIRRRFELRGQVQGVGFRPHVYRLALRHQLAGFVANDSHGAQIEVEGPPDALAAFEHALRHELPPLARITSLTQRDLPLRGEAAFRIHTSEARPDERPEVTPDAATCAACLRELFDPADRRYRYPFINCTNCGPRYSIIRDVPYDRPQTTMAAFAMCPACDREYHDPADRRFHAQPNACPTCGPRVEFVATERRSDEATKRRRGAWASGPCEQRRSDEATRHGGQAARRRGHAFPHSHVPTFPRCHGDAALTAAVAVLDAGGILAVKGLGGFHLACRADDENAVRRLRRRKLRDGKPLAVMVRDLDAARRVCRLTPADEAALASPAAPIVLARKADGRPLAPSIAPGCRDFGVLLPYTPLHHLLFATSAMAGGRHQLGPLVMTSANLAGQPLTYRDDDALVFLGDVADAFLLHNREICRPIDDSVVLTWGEQPMPLRRARGYAPQLIRLDGFAPGQPLAAAGGRRILAVGGELKATVCLLSGGEAILSEHLGDLSHPDAFRHYVDAIERLKQLAGCTPELVACDLHPLYLSTDYARRLGLPVVAVQHHHAHIASVMAEHGEAGPVIGWSCDGTGYGADGAVWGCELLLCERGDYERLGHLEYFPLVGGDRAARETWRPAAALVRAAYGDDWRRAFTAACPHFENPAWLDLFGQQAARGTNAPPTSSLGRVFDAVAFLLGLCDSNRHEAEAAMAVEAAAAEHDAAVEPYDFEVPTADGGFVLSLTPMIRALVAARQAGESAACSAARFHETIARALAELAQRAATACGAKTIALSGGCFANRLLLERVACRLGAARRSPASDAGGLRLLHHRAVPSGDGGLALGQAWVAAWRLLANQRGAGM